MLCINYASFDLHWLNWETTTPFFLTHFFSRWSLHKKIECISLQRETKANKAISILCFTMFRGYNKNLSVCFGTLICIQIEEKIRFCSCWFMLLKWFWFYELELHRYDGQFFWLNQFWKFKLKFLRKANGSYSLVILVCNRSLN